MSGRRDSVGAARSGERGSLAMALLAAIAVGGLVVVITATTVAGQRATRFDQDFSEAVQVADAGVQDALYRLNAGYFSSSTRADTVPVGGTYPTDDAGTPEQERVTRTIDGSPHSWYAQRTAARQWTVTSTGEVRGVSRTVVATITDQPRFQAGAFGVTSVALRGASTKLDSYNSATPCLLDSSLCGWGTDPVHGTGTATLGSNGDMDFDGNVSIKSIRLYDWDANPGTGVTLTDPGGSRCDGGPCGTAGVVSTYGPRVDYSGDAEMAFITDQLARCQAEGRMGGDVSFPASLDLAVEEDEYCYRSVRFDDDFTLPTWASASNPVVLYVSDGVVMEGPGIQINCGGCSGNDPRAVTPAAGALRIYVASSVVSGGADVRIGNQNLFAGVIYAPKARCSGDGGGVHVYGSLTCGIVDNPGNWNFHFDDALADLGAGRFSVSRWAEE